MRLLYDNVTISWLYVLRYAIISKTYDRRFQWHLATFCSLEIYFPWMVYTVSKNGNKQWNLWCFVKTKNVDCWNDWTWHSVLKIVVFVVSVNKLVWMTSFMSCAMSHVYSLIELMTISIACHCGNGDEWSSNWK